jgi:hypothetical protein
MAIISERYKSEYGWSISLPVDWVRLGGDTRGVFSASPAVKFANRANWEIALAWIVRSHPVDPDTLTTFNESVSRTGIVDIEAATAVVNSVFACIGKLDGANALALEDGASALEVIESYTEDGETKRGYQVILPVVDQTNPAIMFQRLCFYAPEPQFTQNLGDVRAAIQSFRYDSPFVIQP